MAFSQKEYIFSHNMTTSTLPNQPVMFRIDLSDLIPPREYSPLFVIDSMSMTGYKQGTCEKIPVKFTVLNGTKKRIVTNDPNKLSCKWELDLKCASTVKIAGTDKIPFKRTISVYEEDNRQGLLNILGFMMSNSLWVSEKSRGAMDILVKSKREDFGFTCDMCSEVGMVHIKKGSGGLPAFSFPQCVDGYVCMPAEGHALDKDSSAVTDLLTLIRSACLDDLDILHRYVEEMANNRCFQELDCSIFPPRNNYGDIFIPYPLMKFVTSLYHSLNDHADNFVVLDENVPNIKVLAESPAENISLITGVVKLTLIYGASVMDIYNKLSQGLSDMDIKADEQPVQGDKCSHEDNLTDIIRIGNEVLIRRSCMTFIPSGSHMPLKEWYSFYYMSS